MPDRDRAFRLLVGLQNGTGQSTLRVGGHSILRAVRPNPFGRSGFWMTHETVQLPSGASALVRGFVVFRGNARSTLTILVQAPKPASGDPHAASEARELANLHDEYARRIRVDRIAIHICETQECIETSMLPATIFYFRGAMTRVELDAPRDYDRQFDCT
jgi:hypothetical protein